MTRVQGLVRTTIAVYNKTAARREYFKSNITRSHSRWNDRGALFKGLVDPDG
jgi:hypothetical protein